MEALPTGPSTPKLPPPQPASLTRSSSAHASPKSYLDESKADVVTFISKIEEILSKEESKEITTKNIIKALRDLGVYKTSDQIQSLVNIQSMIGDDLSEAIEEAIKNLTSPKYETVLKHLIQISKIEEAASGDSSDSVHMSASGSTTTPEFIEWYQNAELMLSGFQFLTEEQQREMGIMVLHYLTKGATLHPGQSRSLNPLDHYEAKAPGYYRVSGANIFKIYIEELREKLEIDSKEQIILIKNKDSFREDLTLISHLRFLTEDEFKKQLDDIIKDEDTDKRTETKESDRGSIVIEINGETDSRHSTEEIKKAILQKILPDELNEIDLQKISTLMEEYKEITSPDIETQKKIDELKAEKSTIKSILAEKSKLIKEKKGEEEEKQKIIKEQTTLRSEETRLDAEIKTLENTFKIKKISDNLGIEISLDNLKKIEELYKKYSKILKTITVIQLNTFEGQDYIRMPLYTELVEKDCTSILSRSGNHPDMFTIKGHLLDILAIEDMETKPTAPEGYSSLDSSYPGISKLKEYLKLTFDFNNTPETHLILFMQTLLQNLIPQWEEALRTKGPETINFFKIIDTQITRDITEIEKNIGNLVQFTDAMERLFEHIFQLALFTSSGHKESIDSILEALTPSLRSIKISTKTLSFTSSGMAAFNQVFKAALRNTPERPFSIRTLDSSYYEILASAKYAEKGSKIQGLTPQQAGQANLFMLDLRPNNATLKNLHKVNFISEYVKLLKTEKLTPTHTIVIDITMTHLSDPEIQAILDHPFIKAQIDSGNLNLCFIQSFAKFVQLGNDKATGGCLVSYNNGSEEWTTFNETITRYAAEDRPSSESETLFKLFLGYANEHVVSHNFKILQNAHLLYEYTKEALRNPTDDTASENILNLVDTSKNEAAYIAFHPSIKGISSPKITELIVTLMNKMAKMESLDAIERSSFGFIYTKWDACDTAIRVNCGVETKETLERYSRFFLQIENKLHEIFDSLELSGPEKADDKKKKKIIAQTLETAINRLETKIDESETKIDESN